MAEALQLKTKLLAVEDAIARAPLEQRDGRQVLVRIHAAAAAAADGPNPNHQWVPTRLCVLNTSIASLREF